MRKLYLFSVLLITAIVAVSCSSGYNAYKKGDYDKAANDAVNMLRKSPGSKKAAFVLSKTYPLVLSTAQRQIDNAKMSNSPTNYEAVVSQYESLNRLADNIYACPAALTVIEKPAEFHNELAQARDIAASQFYSLGVKKLETGTLATSREAYFLLQKANGYSNGYKDVLQKIEDARYLATIRVMFEKPVVGNKYQYSADFFSTNLYTDLSNRLANRLIRFYSYDQGANPQQVRPHHYLVLNFEDFSIGNVFDSKNTVELTKDSVITGTTTVNGKKLNVYGTVKAKLTTHRREIKSGGILSLKIFDEQNKLIDQRNFEGTYTWYTEWGQFNGDERALSKEQRKICNSEPVLPPGQQFLFTEFTRPIYSNALNYIVQYYNRY